MSNDVFDSLKTKLEQMGEIHPDLATKSQKEELLQHMVEKGINDIPLGYESFKGGITDKTIDEALDGIMSRTTEQPQTKDENDPNYDWKGRSPNDSFWTDETDKKLDEIFDRSGS